MSDTLNTDNFNSDIFKSDCSETKMMENTDVDIDVDVNVDVGVGTDVDIRNDIGNDVETNIRKPFPVYTNLVLSGGSVRGISIVGALKELVDRELINFSKLKSVTGTSAGAMCGILIVLGYNANEIKDIIYSLDMAKQVRPELPLLLKKFGVDDGQIIRNFFEDRIVEKTNNRHINFKQLYDLTQIHLTIVASCLTTKIVSYFDHINTPFLSVAVALRASFSMPGFFTPVTINNQIYIDGGILNNYAMNLHESELDNTIGILVSYDYDTNYNCLEEYIAAVLNLFMHEHYYKTIDKYANSTVYITKCPENVSTFNFNITSELKNKLLECGCEAAKQFENMLEKKFVR